MIYMDVVQEIEVIETDVKDLSEKCQKVNCNALFYVIKASLKVLYDLLFICWKKKN